MKVKSSAEPIVADADGTNAEENRQLTNLLLENAIALPAVQATFKQKVQPVRLHFVELAFLTVTFLLLNLYTFASRGSEADENGTLY